MSTRTIICPIHKYGVFFNILQELKLIFMFFTNATCICSAMMHTTVVTNSIILKFLILPSFGPTHSILFFHNTYMNKFVVINLIKFWQYFTLIFEVYKMKLATHYHSQIYIWRTTQKWSKPKFCQIYV